VDAGTDDSLLLLGAAHADVGVQGAGVMAVTVTPVQPTSRAIALVQPRIGGTAAFSPPDWLHLDD
jgi:hypothetical protein